MRVLLAAFLIMIVYSPLANAQSIKSCGSGAMDPKYNVKPNSPFDYCNYYPRRFEYRDARNKLRAQLEERAKNYNAPRQMALDAYKAREEGEWSYSPIIAEPMPQTKPKKDHIETSHFLGQ